MIFNQMFTEKGQIAPSHNQLAANVSLTLPTFQYLDQKVAEVAAKNGLKAPSKDHFMPVQTKNHCVSMSLRFIQHVNGASLEEAAAKMVNGADKTSALGTNLYMALYNAQDKSTIDLHKIKSAVAQYFGLSFEEQRTLKMPLEMMCDHFLNELSEGKYLISFPHHVVVIVKEKNGRLCLFNPDKGTYELDRDRLKDLFVRNKVYNDEKLILHRVVNHPISECKHTEIDKLESWDKIHLSYLPSADRWTNARLKFRGKTYQFVYDTEKGFFYNNDSKALIRLKCAVLCPRVILENTIRVIYHLAKGVFHLLIGAYHKAKKDFMFTGRLLFYSLPAVGATLHGLIKPYEGRSLFGYWERSINGQNKKTSLHTAHYVAPCFTPLNFNESRDEPSNKHALKKHVLRYEFMQDAINNACS